MKVTLTMEDLCEFFTCEDDMLKSLQQYYMQKDSDYGRASLRMIEDRQAFLNALRARLGAFAMMYGKAEGGAD